MEQKAERMSSSFGNVRFRLVSIDCGSSVFNRDLIIFDVSSYPMVAMCDMALEDNFET